MLHLITVFIITLIFSFAALNANLNGRDFSLMLSAAEHKAIDESVARDVMLRDNQLTTPANTLEKVAKQYESAKDLTGDYLTVDSIGGEDVDNLLFLSAILYFDDDHWSIVLNNQIIGEDQKFLGKFTLKHVSPDYIVVTLSGSPEDDYIIRINQTFCLKQRKIVC